MKMLKYVLLAAAVSAAQAQTPANYALPNSKAYLQTCQQQTLLIHPGIIANSRLLHGDTVTERYEMQVKDGDEWLVLCDLATGKIIGEQKLLAGVGHGQHD